MAEGAPLLREYVGKTCIEGSNPSGSARQASEPSPARGFFHVLGLALVSGRQIAEIVKDGGWIQADAAARCGITQPRIDDLLCGGSRFSIDALVNIATSLGRTFHIDSEVT